MVTYNIYNTISSLLMLSLLVDPIDAIDKHVADFGKLLYMIIV